MLAALFGVSYSPYSETVNSSSNGSALSMLFVIPFAILALLSFIGWVMMIIHAAQHDIPNKAVWIVVMVLFNIGWIVYYFVVKRPYDASHNTVSAATNQPPSDPTPPSSDQEAPPVPPVV